MENTFRSTIVHAYFTVSHKGGGLNSVTSSPLPIADDSIWTLLLVRK